MINYQGIIPLPVGAIHVNRPYEASSILNPLIIYLRIYDTLTL